MLRFVRREEIEAVYAAGVDAVAGVIAALVEQIAGQAERLAKVEAELELKRLTGRNSLNSSMAPSKDSPQARKERPKKRSSGKKRGGQEGHQGHTRELIADPQHVVEHWPAVCGACGLPLAGRDTVGEPVRHQVWEVIVTVEVTEHRRMRALRMRGVHAGRAA